jgi:hypothetical protein
MLAISWNNAIEGVLMGGGDTQSVINIHPMTVLAFLAALVAYYVGLVVLLFGRYWMRQHRALI